MTLIQAEAARMGRLVEDLLMLAQFDQDCPVDRHPVDLSSIAARSVLGARLIQPGRPIGPHADAPVIVDGDAERLCQVADNLIGNALQHTPQGSAVAVTVRDRAGAAELIVVNQGPGMTADQASRVFERFYRTDRARSPGRGGNGLGLSSTAALVEAHDGTITVGTGWAAAPRSRSGCRSPLWPATRLAAASTRASHESHRRPHEALVLAVYQLGVDHRHHPATTGGPARRHHPRRPRPP